MFTFVNEKFCQNPMHRFLVNIVVINLDKVRQTNTQFFEFHWSRWTMMTSFASLDITRTDNSSCSTYLYIDREFETEEKGEKKKKKNIVETNVKTCGIVSRTIQYMRSSKRDRGDRGMKFNWFRVCTAYRRPMTSHPNMVTVFQGNCCIRERKWRVQIGTGDEENSYIKLKLFDALVSCSKR